MKHDNLVHTTHDFSQNLTLVCNLNCCCKNLKYNCDLISTKTKTTIKIGISFLTKRISILMGQRTSISLHNFVFEKSADKNKRSQKKTCFNKDLLI